MKWLIPFLAIYLHATIIDISHFAELVDYVDEKTLVLVDIDDTLLITKQMLGCDEWFQQRYKETQSLEKALAEWEAVRHLTEMELVEAETDQVIKKLQTEKIQLMGFTTQGLALATRTVQQLLAEQIDLSITAPLQEDHYFQVGQHGILFRNGVLFTSGTHKGKALFQFWEGASLSYPRIVFINDKASHLQEVEREAEARGIEFVGLRYGYSDVKKGQFSPLVADYQFTHSSLKHLLSDEEALVQMGKACE